MMHLKTITAATFIALFSNFVNLNFELPSLKLKIQTKNVQAQAQTPSRKKEAVNLVNQGIEQMTA